MKTFLSKKHEQALTLIELLVVIAGLAFLAMTVDFGVPTRAKARALRIQCVNNLKQTGLAFQVWAGDNTNRFPMAVAETNGGSMDFITSPSAFRHFLVMSNELSTPKAVVCPAEDRFPATNWIHFNNSNLSYFVGVDATKTNAQMILSGDHNITNDMPIQNGILDLTTNHESGWTAEVHNKVGNLLMADGSVQQLSIGGLRTMVANTGFATNRLQMPILSP